MSGGHSDPEVPEPAGEKAGTEGDGEGVRRGDTLTRKCKMQNAECKIEVR